MRKLDPVRVVHWGLDSVGLATARLTWRRPGLIPAGAIDAAGGRVGRDLGDVLGYGERLGIAIHADPEAVLATARPDVTFLSVGDRFDEVAPKVIQAMEAGSNVICLAADLVYPWATHPDLAEKLDDLAHAHGVTVLGTGLHPGFMLDTLVLALTGCCSDVERIRSASVSAVSDPSQIRQAGGLEQSVHLVADALGWPLDRVEHQEETLKAEVRRRGDDWLIEPGQVGGVIYRAIGHVGGLPRIILEQHRQAAPEAEGILTGHFLDLEGQPNLQVNLTPAIPEERGSAAVAVNMVAAVLQAGPGLKTMAELPVPRAVLGDLRDWMTIQGPTIEEELAQGWHVPGLGGHDPIGRDQSGIESP